MIFKEAADSKVCGFHLHTRTLPITNSEISQQHYLFLHTQNLTSEFFFTVTLKKKISSTSRISYLYLCFERASIYLLHSQGNLFAQLYNGSVAEPRGVNIITARQSQS